MRSDLNSMDSIWNNPGRVKYCTVVSMTLACFLFVVSQILMKDRKIELNMQL